MESSLDLLEHLRAKLNKLHQLLGVVFNWGFDHENLSNVRLLAIEFLTQLFTVIWALLVVEMCREVADWAILTVHPQAGNLFPLAIDLELMDQVLDQESHGVRGIGIGQEANG